MCAKCQHSKHRYNIAKLLYLRVHYIRKRLAIGGARSRQYPQQFQPANSFNGARTVGTILTARLTWKDVFYFVVDLLASLLRDVVGGVW